MIYRASVLFFVTSILLTGCGGAKKHWVKSDVPRSETEQAMAECKYQAEAATVSIGSGGHYKTYEKAISAGVAAGVEQAMDQQKLIKDCMEAKGFK
ncbi:hypothetical protein G6L33_22870 [Agrobacterium rhizogenes]|nr:hypothetical protein [Rhizobium rhizogenes]NTH66705.1 hypothetical protein [Rhizobium rhizogenes]